MTRKNYSILLTLFLATVFGIHSAAIASSDMIGKQRPDFRLPDLNDKPRAISEWNDKVIVLNFWASWCTPCLKEIPIFNKVQREYADDVQFVGLAVDNKPAVQEFISKVPIDYPVIYGERNAFKIIKAYGNSKGVLPYTVIIDKQGKIAAILMGGIDRKTLVRTIERHL
jgi:thiol-disulfide isomerase/thioredoxin